MLLKRTHLFLEILLGIFVAYLVISRLFIIGLQAYPQQSLDFLGQLTDRQFSVSSLQLEQTWLGAKFDIQDFKMLNRNADLEVARIKGDINLFAPMIPVLSFGKSLHIEDLKVRKLRVKDTTESDIRGVEQLDFSYRQFVQFLRSQTFTLRMWQRVSIDNAVLEGFLRDKDSSLQIDNLDLVKASQINLVAEFGISYREILNNERFSAQLTFAPNSWGGLSHGRADLVNYQSLRVKGLAKLLPAKWAEVLPGGEVLVDWHVDFRDSKVQSSIIKLNAQALHWSEKDDVLPHSVGLDIQWSPSLSWNSPHKKSNFLISNVQLDNQFVETLSPIKFSILDKNLLSLSAEKFDIKPFKETLQVFVDNHYFADLLNHAVELQVSDFELGVNWQTLDIPTMRVHFARLGIPVTDYPGIAARDLTLSKDGKSFVLQSGEAIWIQEPKIHATAMRLILPKQVRLQSVNGIWHAAPNTFKLDNFSVQIRQLSFSESLFQSKLKVSAPEVTSFMSYLPYQYMGESLNKWLVEANLQGGSPEFTVEYQSPVMSAREDGGKEPGLAEFLEPLRIKGHIKNLSMQFNSEWPKIVDTDAGVEFKNNQLYISSSALKFAKSDAVLKATAIISDLTSKNIALTVSGKTNGKVELSSLTDFMIRTPLAEQLSVDSYLRQSSAFSGKGELALEKLWIPLFGHGTEKESVIGRVKLHQAGIALQDFPEMKVINGEFRFTEQSLKADKVNFNLFNQPASLDVATNKSQQIEFSTKGAWVDSNQLLFAKPLPFRVRILVPLQKGETHSYPVDGVLQVQQANSQLPSPFSSLEITQPAKFSGALLQKQLILGVNIDSLLKAKLNWDLDNHKLSKIQAYIGNTNSANTSGVTEHSFIKGYFSKLDADEWWNWWGQLPTGEEDSFMDDILWQGTDVQLNHVTYKAQSFNEVRLQQNETALGNSVIQFVSKEAAGKVLIPKEGVIEVDIDRLMIAAQKNVHAKATDSSICYLSKTSIDYPDISVKAKNVGYEQYRFNQIDFTVHPTALGFETKDLNAQLSRGAGRITGSYLYDQQKNLSAATLDLKSQNLKELLTFLQINQGISAKQSDVHADIAWFGGLDCFTTKGLFGKLNFKLNEGVVNNVEPGFARLLGLLSVDSLARRLQLKLDDVTNEGLIYDKIDGQGLLKNSKLILESFKLDAPAAKVKMKGDIKLDTEIFDLEADVTPSVGSSLPTIAALAGLANPFTALAVYTLMKVIPDINENLITYKYEITGPWKEPQFKLIPPKSDNYDLQ